MRALAIVVLAVGCKSPEPAIAWPEVGQTKVLLHEDRVENAYPRLSRDMRSVLYQSNRGGHWQLYVLDVASGVSRAVMETASNETLPDWSVDGRIAWVSDRDGNEEVYVMDGDKPRRISNSPGRDLHPYWSPDGTALLYNTQEHGSFDVVRVELASGATERLTSSSEDDTCARYAPDGKRIALLRNDARADDVVVIADGVARDMTKTPAVRDGWPAWSPDGAWIYYASMADGAFSIYRVAAAGGAPERLTTAAPGEEDARPFVSADGRLLVYNKRAAGAIDIRVLRLS
jgi:TolB protein